MIKILTPVLRVYMLGLLSFSSYKKASCQENVEKLSSKELHGKFKSLIELNSSIEGLITFDNEEYISIKEHATTTQIIEFTKPFLTSKIINAKNICLYLLNFALTKEASLLRRRQIVELICKNYLERESIEFSDNILLSLQESDFNLAAKKHIARLSNKDSKCAISEAAKISAVAQVKESIPFLWSMVNKDVSMMESKDVDILISLARMNEKQAGVLLCEYYNTEKRITDNDKHVFLAKRLSFSLDKSVLLLFIADYKTMDLNKAFRDGCSGYHPAQILGEAITAMLKDYPYIKNEDANNTNQLLNWLKTRTDYHLAEK